MLFIITFYWISFSPWSSLELAKYNDGYGTFDMKSYNTNIVYEVLDRMEPQGFAIYPMYFLGDFLFIINLAFLQIALLYYAYCWSNSKILRVIFVIIPVIRGICDLTENALLLYVLQTYPDIHRNLVNYANWATSMKLSLNILYFSLLPSGFIIKIIRARGIQNKKDNHSV